MNKLKQAKLNSVRSYSIRIKTQCPDTPADEKTAADKVSVVLLELDRKIESAVNDSIKQLGPTASYKITKQ